MKQLNLAKLWVLLFVFFAVALKSKAQKEIGTIDLKLEKGTEITSFVNSNNGSYGFLYTPKKQKSRQSGIVIFDQSGNLLNLHKVNYSAIDLQFTRMDEWGYHFYFFDGSSDQALNLDLIKLSIGVESGQASYEKLEISIGAKDRFLGITSDEHSVFVIFWNKKFKGFKVVSINNMDTISTQNIRIEGYYDPTIFKANSSILQTLPNFNLLPKHPINDDMLNLLSDMKFYAFPGGIYLTHEMNGKTSIYEMDFSKSEAKLIKRLLNPVTLAENGSNSYIYGDKLFKLSFDKKRLSLIVFDLTSKSVLKEFILQPGSKPTLLKSSIYSRDGKDIWHKVYGVMEDTEIMLDWLPGQPWISVEKTNTEQYLLELGSYQGHQWGNSDKLQSTQKEFTRSFYSYLDGTTYEIESSEMLPSKPEQVKQYLAELKPEKYLISHLIQLSNGEVILLYAFDWMEDLQLVRF